MSSYIPIDRQISDRTGKLKCFFLRRMVCRNYSVYAYLHCSNRAYHLRPSFHDAHSLQKTAVSIITHRPNVSNYKMTIIPSSFTGQPSSVPPSRCCPYTTPSRCFLFEDQTLEWTNLHLGWNCPNEAFPCLQ